MKLLVAQLFVTVWVVCLFGMFGAMLIAVATQSPDGFASQVADILVWPVVVGGILSMAVALLAAIWNIDI